MKRLCYIMVLLSIVFTTNFAMAEIKTEKDSRLLGFIDNVGVDWQYGKDKVLPDTARGDHCYNTVNRISVRAETRGPWFFSDKWGLQGELQYSAHKADELPDHGQDTGFKEVGFNLALKYFFFNDLFYAGFFGGLSCPLDFPEFEHRDYWADRDIESNLGRSGILGSWGPMIGRDWRVKNSPWSLKTEMRFTHTSDPLTHNDRGKNYASMVLGLTYHWPVKK